MPGSARTPHDKIKTGEDGHSECCLACRLLVRPIRGSIWILLHKAFDATRLTDTPRGFGRLSNP